MLSADGAMGANLSHYRVQFAIEDFCCIRTVLLYTTSQEAGMFNINRRLGIRIRLLRRMMGLTQEQLADFAAIHRTHMGEIERGEGNVTIATLLKVAAGLDISIYALLRGIDHSDTRTLTRLLSAFR